MTTREPGVWVMQDGELVPAATIPGPPGLSAYEFWLSQGNTGTEEDYFAEIEGDTGPQGPQGDENVHLLNNGETVPEYETRTGITVPNGAIIYEKA